MGQVFLYGQSGGVSLPAGGENVSLTSGGSIVQKQITIDLTKRYYITADVVDGYLNNGGTVFLIDNGIITKVAATNMTSTAPYHTANISGTTLTIVGYPAYSSGSCNMVICLIPID